MDWSQIQAIFSNWGVVQWGIAAVIGSLILGLDKQLVPLAKGAAGYFKWLRSRGAAIIHVVDDEHDFPPPPEQVDDMPPLIHKMRLCVCDEVPSVRDGCNKHLDEIEQLISGTEVDRSE